MSKSAAILSVGMSTPLGVDARQSALVLRARKMAPAKTAFQDRHGFAIGNVRASRLNDATVGRRRLLSLAAPALQEALRGVPNVAMPLFVSVPERRGEAEALGPEFFGDLAKAAGANVVLEASEGIAIGHAGFAVALQRAIESVTARAPKSNREPPALAICGGVDSHHDPAVLKVLDEERRLHGAGTRDGLIPSEAAAFLVISAHEVKSAYARVTAVSTGAEREEGGDDAPMGEAATEVVRNVAGTFGEVVPWVLCDVNGEHHRVKEWTFVRVRNREFFDADHTVETRPYDELGDVGAATGAVYSAYACVAFRMGFAPAPRVLVTLRSEGPARAAFVLEGR